MQSGPIFIPPGTPPGVAYAHQDGPPEAILYFRIYAGFIAFCGVATMLLGLYLVVDGSLGSSTSRRSDLMGMGLGYAVAGAFFAVPYLVGLFAGRRPWVHTLGTVLIVLTMATTCCLPIAILLLVAWIKPEVKRWYETG
jgi:hypothetical protein